MTTAILSTTERGAWKPALSARLGGISGLVFVVTVIFQNVVRAVIDPAADASPADVTAWTVDHRLALELLAALFLFEMPFLAAFVATIYRRTVSGPSGWLAATGLIGALAIVVFFSINVAVEVALTAQGAALADSPAVTSALWSFHQALFAMNFAAVGVALLGLGLAAAAHGLIPRWMGYASVAGAVLLVGGSLGAVAATEGSMAPLAIAMPGWLVWMAFVAVASFRLAASPEPVA